jgi:hypothetical protein
MLSARRMMALIAVLILARNVHVSDVWAASLSSEGTGVYSEPLPAAGPMRLAANECSAVMAGPKTRCRRGKARRKKLTPSVFTITRDATAAAGSGPAVRLIANTGGVLALPQYGHVDKIKLDNDGHTLEVVGWIAPPPGSAANSVDEIQVFLETPAEGIEIISVDRPDVRQRKGVGHLNSGFAIRIKLRSRQESLPINAVLCIAASFEGKLIVRTHDPNEMRCQ